MLAAFLFSMDTNYDDSSRSQFKPAAAGRTYLVLLHFYTEMYYVYLYGLNVDTWVRRDAKHID